jgi:hypothetical protein
VRTLSDEELIKAGKRLRIVCGDVVAFPFTLAELWPRVGRAMLRPVWRSIGLIFLFVLSLAVYYLRQIFTRSYAVVEITVGMIIAWGALGTQSVQGGSLLQGIALAGSVYAFVSGIDDFIKGEEERRKPLWRR